jgi:16S rRNA (cytosine1402-N4)-methyltransferase
METISRQHIPVMLEPVMRLLSCRAGGIYVDTTLGGGGYARAILEASAPNGILLALDWDAEALVRAGKRLQEYGRRLFLQQANFADLSSVLRELDLGAADGIVMDLGVSSFHLEDAGRGFSFQYNGPLDMRMDQRQEQTAADLVNTLPEEDLRNLIHDLGEERWARRIARAMVVRRHVRLFSRTRELADLIQSVVPKSRDALRIHPATRTFQALRMLVNSELENLRSFLSHVLDVLQPGGRLVIVAFHSLEDRIVKQQLKIWANPCQCPPRLPRCQCVGTPLVRLLTKKVLRPTSEELELNPRSRSAKLRAVTKL